MYIVSVFVPEPAAQYDDGANVFSNYLNFAGTTLPSGWVYSSSITGIVNNGITLSSSSSAQYLGYQTPISSPFVYDIYGKVVNPSTSEQSNLLALVGTGLSGSSYYDWSGERYQSGNYLDYGIGGSWMPITSILWYINTFYLNSVAVTSSGTSEYVNYNQLGSSTSSGGLSSSYLMVWQDNTETFVQWLRTRVYPPNGVMPSASFGSVV